MLDYLKRTCPWVGLALLVAAPVHYSVVGEWFPFHLYVLIAGGVLLLAGAVLNQAELVHALRTRKALHGGNFLISVAVLLAVLGLINVLVVRHNQRLDTTPDKLYSLSDQTRKIVGGLKAPIQAYVFADRASEPVSDLLKEYQSATDKLRWQVLDPDRNLDKAQKYGVRSYNTIVLESGDRFELVEAADEAKVTSAILKLTQNRTRKIYFVEGHGEKSITDTQERGYTILTEALKKDGYEIAAVNLVQKQGVPADCTVLVVAGAQKEPFPQELDWIRDYTRKGGALLVLTDPMAATLDPLVAEWGIRPRNDLVLDTSNINRLLGSSPGIPLVTRYPDHAITRGMSGMSVFPLVRSLEEIAPAPAGVTIQRLLETDPESWAETDFAALDKTGQAEFNEGRDTRGPVTIGLAAEREFKSGDGPDAAKTVSRLVVIGDSEFAANAYFGAQYNGDIFLNCVNWLAVDENLISIRPKNPADKRVMLTAAHEKLMFYFSVVLLPLIPLVIGVVVRVIRRRKR